MEKKIKKICFFTTSRADYSLMSVLIKDFQKDSYFDTRVLVSGAHLHKKYGLTYKEIKNDGIKIHKKIFITENSTNDNSMSKFFSNAVLSFSSYLRNNIPDIVFLLGDRYELLPMAQSCFFLDIPIAHIGGGESSFGSKDETIRNIISKFSWLHFVATESYKNKIFQLGENPKNVFNVGGLSVESIKKTKILDKNDLEKNLNIRFKKKNLLITFHPNTISEKNSDKDYGQLLKALSNLKDTLLIFTYPNADYNNQNIVKLTKQFVKKNKKSRVIYKSLGRLHYLSTLYYVDGVLGNSSSGITEAPSFKKGTINIGDRQEGRVKSISVIDCKPIKEDIFKSINYLYSNKFNNILKKSRNPYGEGLVSKQIIKIVKNKHIPKNLKKIFYEYR